MSQPPEYTITVNFADEEADATAGRSTVRTSALDVELQNIAASLSAAIANLGNIQRDDGNLRDGIVVPFSLSTASLALIGSSTGSRWTPRGPWVTLTAYAYLDMIEQGSASYLCLTAHTAGVFATDYAAGKWMVIGPSVTGITAASVSFTPVGTIIATTVQSAIAEVASESLQKSSNLSDLANVATARTNLSVPSKSEIQQMAPNYCVAAGTLDAITGAFTPAIASLASPILCYVESAGANTTTTPTFNADGTGAKTIVKGSNQALVAGDIPGANFLMQLAFDVSLDKWVLLNPAYAVSVVPVSSTSSLVNQNPPVRQTVLSGPVDSNGLPNFGGVTGSGTVTMSGTLIVTAANGFDITGSLNRTGSGANLSWTGLTTNGTMYLGVTVNSDGTLTTFSTTLAPTYRWGGADVVTANQHTFNVQEMTMKVGNGATAAQAYKVFCGEVTVAGGVVTAITWYALMGRFLSSFTATLPGAGTAVSYTHNIGVAQLDYCLEIECTTAEANWVIGDQLPNPTNNGVTAGAQDTQQWANYKSAGFTTNNGTGFASFNKTTGAQAALTLANWKYRMRVRRVW